MARVKKRHKCKFVQRLLSMIVGYLKDSNAAANSVDSGIFYGVINLSARSKFSIIILFLSSVKLRWVTKSVLVCINFMHHDASMARCDKGSRQ